jgi:integrase
MASFEPRGNSVRAVVRVGGGKKAATFDTMTEAQNWASDMEKLKTLGQVTSAKSLTVQDLFDAYLVEAEKTDSAKWNSLRLLKWAGSTLSKKAIRDVTTHDINEWIDARLTDKNPKTDECITGSTVNRELNLLSSAFQYAVKTRKWISVNPCHGASRPATGPSRNRALLTPEEVKALQIATGFASDPQLRTKTARVGACFLLALETGMRSGEILRLKLEDFRPDVKTVVVAAREIGGRKSSKSGRSRVSSARNVPLTARAIELLQLLKDTMPADQKPMERLANPPYLVGLDDSQRDSLWRKSVKMAGVEDLHYHDTKHEAATKMCKFLDVLALSHALGVKDVKLLRDVYYQNDAQRSAALLPAQLAA